MAKVKIGKKEYELGSLSSLDLKKLEAKKAEGKIEEYDYAYFCILHAIKRFNPNVTFTLEEFMDEFPIKNISDKFKEIGDIIGLDFKVGILKSPGGKIQ